MKTLEEQVIEYYRTQRENTIPAIARKFQVPKHKVNKIIDEYLKKKGR